VFTTSVLAISLSVAVIAIGAVPALAQSRPVILGTATPGGGFPVYGQAVAETVNATDPTLRPITTTRRADEPPAAYAG
jgi:TRAP-type uncharacterized transport system substrate-binding protein